MGVKKKNLLLAAGAMAALPVFLVHPGYAPKSKKAAFTGVNFAHRGLHTEDKSVPENSLKAFELAAAAGYGIELDVQLSSDGQVVVFHDDTLDRVCGVHARVNEKTYEELHALSLCGSAETIPLFTDVLDVIGGRGPLIVELKTCKKKKELCEKTLAILRSYRGDVCIESFDPAIVMWFRFHGREYIRGQLAMAAHRYELKPKLLGFCASRTLFNFLTRPQFIAYCIGEMPPLVKLSCALGAIKVGWTSHEEKNEKDNDSVIFEFYTPHIKIFKNRSGD